MSPRFFGTRKCWGPSHAFHPQNSKGYIDHEDHLLGRRCSQNDRPAHPAERAGNCYLSDSYRSRAPHQGYDDSRGTCYWSRGRIRIALAARESTAQTPRDLLADLQAASRLLHAARPTAVNLAWALARITRFAESQTDLTA